MKLVLLSSLVSLQPFLTLELFKELIAGFLGMTGLVYSLLSRWEFRVAFGYGLREWLIAFSLFYTELIGWGCWGISEELLQLCSLSWFSFAIAFTWSGLLREVTEPLLLGNSASICCSWRQGAGGLASLGILLPIALIIVWMLVRMPSFSIWLTEMAFVFLISVVSSMVLPDELLWHSALLIVPYLVE